MYLRDVLTSLRRRWLFVVAAFLVTAAVVFGLSSVVKPTYQSTASVVLVPPVVKDDPTGNRYMNLGNLGGAVEVLSRSMSSADTVALMERVAPGATYTVALDPTTSAPVLAVATSASTPVGASTLMQALLSRLPTELVTLQQSVNVPKDNRITSLVVSQDKTPRTVQKSRIRLLGVAFIGLFGAFLLAIAAVDGLLMRRRRGRASRSAVPADRGRGGPASGHRARGQHRDPREPAHPDEPEAGLNGNARVRTEPESASVRRVRVRDERDRD